MGATGAAAVGAKSLNRRESQTTSKRTEYGAVSDRAPPASRDANTDTETLEITSAMEISSQIDPRPSRGDTSRRISSGCRTSNVGVIGKQRQPVRRECVVFIVFLALLLDSILLTCMAPIIPNYLRDRGHGDNPLQPNSTSNTLTIETHSSKQRHVSRFLTPTSTKEISAKDELHKWLQLEQKHNSRFCSLLVIRAESSQDSDNKFQFFLKSTPHSKKYAMENTKISLLFASKTLAQFLTNLIVGPLTERIGYTVPLFYGFVVLLLSTVAFAFGASYELLFAARAFQGIGTAFSTTSGMGLLAFLYPDQNERAVAQTKAFSGLALGVLVGPPYGGILYELFGGKEILCLILAGTALFEGVLQLFVMRPTIERGEKRGPSILKLLTDPYILITAAAITIANLTTAVLEPALPIWMFYTMNASSWLQGVAFVPSTLSYLLFLQLFGFLASRTGCFKISHRWSYTMFGLVLLAVSLAAVPYCPNFYFLIGPTVIMGFGLAHVCSCMLPNIGSLVDHRHEPVYGSAYAITDNAFCLAFAVGPAISGPLIDTIGFTWTLRGVSVIILLFVPLVFCLRNPPGKTLPEQETSLVASSEKTEVAVETLADQTTPIDSDVDPEMISNYDVEE